MYISTQDGDSDAVFPRQLLQTQNQSLALLLVLVSRVMVIQIVQKIDAAVKLVEETAADAESFVE